MATIIVNKLDAARRQLETAALLYFNDRDSVSVHTLAAAAYEIVEAIAQKRGRSTLVQRNVLNFLPPELSKDIRKAMRKPQNFLKHADRDHNEQLELEPAFSEMLMLDAMATYAQITGEIPAIFNAFSMWFGMKNPQMIGTESESRRFLMEAQQHFSTVSRSDFLRQYLSANAVIV